VSDRADHDGIPASPIDLPSIPDVISRELRRDIARGIYKPGPIRIRPIAERFNVSATPVREALQRLEAEGLITMRKNQILVNALSEAELHEIFTIRSELEALAVRLGAERIPDPGLFDDLELLMKTMDRHQRDPEEWRVANERFHLRIYRMAGMPRLNSIIDALWIAVEPYLRLYVFTAVDTFPAAQDQHHAIVDHLREGDVDSAANVLRQHLRDTEEVLALGMQAESA